MPGTSLCSRLSGPLSWKVAAVLFFTNSLSLCVVAQRNTFADPGPILQCREFIEGRTEHEDRNFIRIPRNRTSAGIYTPNATLPIKYPFYYQGTFSCPDANTEVRTVQWNQYVSTPQPLEPRNFESVSSATQDPPKNSYFTASAHFYDADTHVFYKPGGEYCLAGAYDHEITVKVCKVPDNCISLSNPNIYCLPKCCAVDEVLSVSTRKCIPAENVLDYNVERPEQVPIFSGVTPWIPPLYSDKLEDHAHFRTVQVIQRWLKPPDVTQFTTADVSFQMAKLPETCNKNLSGEAHLKFWTDELGDYQEQYNIPIDDYVRLGISEEIGSGTIVPMLYNREKEAWEKQTSYTFCVDGYFWGDAAGGMRENRPPIQNDHNYVVVYCNAGGMVRYRVSGSLSGLVVVYLSWVFYWSSN